MHRTTRALVACVVGLALAATACSASATDSGSARPSVVVTTSILGDVVEHLIGGLADVTVLMPPGAAPHDFQASARQAVEMRDADLLVVNGLGFEAGLAKAIDAARDDGVPTFDASDAITPRRTPGGTPDPHFFTDPVRMATVAEALVPELARWLGLEPAALRPTADAYLAQLRAADRSIERTLAAVPPARRKLVTNHDVFGYFAARYGFEVVGAIVPNVSPDAEPSAKALDALATTIRDERVPAIFADTSSPTALAQKLADEAGVQVRVVPLYSESLGAPGTSGASYIAMMTTDAQRIASALRA